MLCPGAWRSWSMPETSRVCCPKHAVEAAVCDKIAELMFASSIDGLNISEFHCSCIWTLLTDGKDMSASPILASTEDGSLVLSLTSGVGIVSSCGLSGVALMYFTVLNPESGSTDTTEVCSDLVSLAGPTVIDCPKSCRDLIPSC